jgi:hypothetical protein
MIAGTANAHIVPNAHIMPAAWQRFPARTVISLHATRARARSAAGGDRTLSVAVVAPQKGNASIVAAGPDRGVCASGLRHGLAPIVESHASA